VVRPPPTALAVVVAEAPASAGEPVCTASKKVPTGSLRFYAEGEEEERGEGKLILYYKNDIMLQKKDDNTQSQ
jgi:hypothetical protein